MSSRKILVGCIVVSLCVFVLLQLSSPSSPSSSSVSSPQQQQQQVEDAKTQRTEQQPVVAINVLPLKQHVKAITRCSESLSSSNNNSGSMWDSTTNECIPIPGWNEPLADFEVSTEELSCEQGVKQHNGGGGSTSSSWRSFAFSSKTDELYANSSDFVRQTSWLFRQFRPYEDEDRAFEALSLDVPLSEFTFRSGHDSAAENLFRIDNFCLHPWQGLFSVAISSQQQQQQRPGGKDETRDFFHSEPSFHMFLGRIKKLDTVAATSVPRVFHRPAVFIYLSPLSRGNLWHTLHKFLNLLGILKMQQQLFPGSTLKPLLVFVHDVYPDDNFNNNRNSKWHRHHEEQQHTTTNQQEEDEITASSKMRSAFGFFIRLLADNPWAVVTLPGPIATDQAHLAKMFQRTRHYFDDSTFASLPVHPSSAGGAGGSPIVRVDDSNLRCIRRAVVLHNCYSCTQNDPNSEKESYSFGMWVPLTAARNELLHDFHRLVVESCLPLFIFKAAEAVGGQQQQQTRQLQLQQVDGARRLPRVFFDVRSARNSRVIVDFPLFAAELERDLVHRRKLVSRIDFREPWRGSPAKYRAQLHNADIFIGVHGGAFANLPAFAASVNNSQSQKTDSKKKIVIEITSSLHFATVHKEKLRGMVSDADASTCWFGIYSRAFGFEHWLLQVDSDRNLRPVEALAPRTRETPLFVPRHVLSEVIGEAAAAWRSGGGANDDDDNFRQRRLNHQEQKLPHQHINITVEKHYTASYLAELLRLFFGANTRATRTVMADDDKKKNKKIQHQKQKNKAGNHPLHRFIASVNSLLRHTAVTEELLFLCSHSCTTSAIAAWRRVMSHFLARDDLHPDRFRKKVSGTPMQGDWRLRTQLCITRKDVSDDGGGDADDSEDAGAWKSCLGIFRVVA